jgi:hypothetical protein
MISTFNLAVFSHSPILSLFVFGRRLRKQAREEYEHALVLKRNFFWVTGELEAHLTG